MFRLLSGTQRTPRCNFEHEQGEHMMNAPKWTYALALLALVAVPVVAVAKMRLPLDHGLKR